MGKLILLVCGSLVLCVGSMQAAVTTPTTQTVLLQGEVDLDMLNKVRAELEAAERTPSRTVRFDLLSPGGGVVIALEIARLSHLAHERHGVTVEMHASSLCASACTAILASGTPGHRYISRETLFIVHPIQGGGMTSGCLDRPEAPTTQDEKALAVVYGLLIDSYARSTGNSPEVVADWMICGREHVGTGSLAVEMKIADAVES